MALKLDRIAVEETGGNPERMASVIHDQLGDLDGPVPVYEIARALDIEEVREEPLSGLEGALITPPEKGYGAILVNSRSSRQRRRYTMAHELCHFLSPWHKPTTELGFNCIPSDMIERSEQTRHARQEAEANRFAIELLAPRRRLRPFLGDSPDLAHVLEMADEFYISKEAAVRRYVELRDETLAIVFSKNGIIDYVDRPAGTPFLSVWKGHRLPLLSQQGGRQILAWTEVDPRDWVVEAGNFVRVQMLHQINGRAMTLVEIEDPAADLED